MNTAELDQPDSKRVSADTGDHYLECNPSTACLETHKKAELSHQPHCHITVTVCPLEEVKVVKRTAMYLFYAFEKRQTMFNE